MNPEKIFVTGDKVEVIAGKFRGVTARVVNVTTTAFGRMYSVLVIDGKGLLVDGVRETFGPSALSDYREPSASNPRAALVGTIIKPSEVQVGDEIEVSHKVRDTSRTSAGIAHNIRTGWAGDVCEIKTEGESNLYLSHYVDPQIKLIKAAEDALTVKLRNSPVRTVFLAEENSHGIKISADRWKVDNSVERRVLTTHDLRLSLKGKKVVFLKAGDALRG